MQQQFNFIKTLAPSARREVITQTGTDSFIEYLLMFYGEGSDVPYPMGLTQEHAEIIALTQFMVEGVDFEGDSISREQAIQIGIEEFGYEYPPIPGRG